MSLVGKVALITGGASGLGRATATRLANAGAKVMIVDLPTAPCAEAVNAIGPNARFTHADVSSEADIKNVLAEIEKHFGQVNVAVNCAGICPASRVLTKNGPFDLNTFAKCLTVNTVGTFNVIRLVGEKMAAGPADSDNERGVIINTASVAAYEGQIGQAAYSASKGGVVAMTLPIAREFASFGIRVNTIAPGIMSTPMLEAMPAKLQEALAAQVPFPRRLGKGDEYAALAQHIIENHLINGETIRLDGAIRLSVK